MSLIHQATDEELVSIIREKYRRDILAFARVCITEDPHDSKNPWKPFPVNKVPYVKELLLSYTTDRKVIVVKSRQVMVTWIYVIATLWSVLFTKGQRVALISRKGGASKKLVERIKFVYDKLPDEWKPPCRFTFHPEPSVRCDSTESAIFAYPQGADQLRSETFSVIFSDEFAFQDDQDKTYTASKPTIDGGGCFIAVSTPNGKNNLFYTLSKDPAFRRFDIHYSQNPFKDENWKKEAFSGLKDAAVQQEYELNFLAANTNRIYNDFNTAIHVKELIANPNQPLYVGWDFGYNRPAIVFVQLDGNKIKVLGSKMGYKTVLEHFIQSTFSLQSMVAEGITDVRDFCDIAGKQKNAQTGKSDVQILNSMLIKIGRMAHCRKTVNIEEGHNLIRQFLTGLRGGEPLFQIDPRYNAHLIEALNGGYHYHGTNQRICGCGTNEFGEIESDLFKHNCDCLRYILENLFNPTGKIPSVKTNGLPKKPLGKDLRFQGSYFKNQKY